MAIDENSTNSHTGNALGGFVAMTRRDKTAYSSAASEYFQYWDGKEHENETDGILNARESRTRHYAGLTRKYYHLSTDIFEHAWGESFHFCRFARRESFERAIARHEHYLASVIGIKTEMRVLDVGCGVGGPAREIVKFTGCHVTGLNISEYQLGRARIYAKRDGVSHRLDFVQGDFMVCPGPYNLGTPFLFLFFWGEGGCGGAA